MKSAQLDKLQPNVGDEVMLVEQAGSSTFYTKVVVTRVTATGVFDAKGFRFNEDGSERSPHPGTGIKRHCEWVTTANEQLALQTAIFKVSRELPFLKLRTASKEGVREFLDEVQKRTDRLKELVDATR
jgi:hypothetical protein